MAREGRRGRFRLVAEQARFDHRGQANRGPTTTRPREHPTRPGPELPANPLPGDNQRIQEDIMRHLTHGRMLAVSLAAGLVLAACAEDTAEDTTDSATAEGATVETATGEPGTFLTDADGLTLYLFTNDTPGMSNCSGDCLTAWPALLTGGDPVAGSGVDASLLGTTTRDDGSVQVTYSGWPLYFFAGDAAPGDLEGQGVNDVWFAISPEGEQLVVAPGADSMDTSSGYTY
jgi:predicted lipoprotein with Yx(FWY)xxD motif